jgi:hypothetical protein
MVEDIQLTFYPNKKFSHKIGHSDQNIIKKAQKCFFCLLKEKKTFFRIFDHGRNDHFGQKIFVRLKNTLDTHTINIYKIQSLPVKKSTFKLYKRQNCKFEI